MSWVAVGVAAVGATSSYMNNQAKKKQETANQMANATAMEMSPWTHQNVSMMGKTTGSDIASVMQGGLAGAQFGSQFRGSPKAPDSVSPSPDASGGNAIGGNDMSAQLGAQGDAGMKSMSQMPALQSAPQQPPMSVASQPGSPWGSMVPSLQKKPSMYGSY